ncbi:MAG: type II and III secretion system protein [Cyanobacteria bacterium P01_A01_bin.83]
MTFADDFASDDQLMEEDYPSAFGITFTPMVIGIVIGVAGITLAIYGFIKFVKPAQTEYQNASSQKQELEAQLTSIKTGDLQLKLAQAQSDLAEKKVLKSRVLSMFTSENDLETLLIDLNNFIATNEGALTQYQPDSNVSTISDASLGAEVQGKLKRKGISLTFEGTFNETKQILQDLERLQPLLMVQSISSSVTEEPTAILTNNRSEIVPQKQAELKTQIKLDAILPLSEAELERAKKADQQAEQAERNNRRNRNSRDQ